MSELDAANTILSENGVPYLDGTVLTRLRHHFGKREKQVTIPSIIRAASERFRVLEAEILGPSRVRNICKARQVAMYLARKHTDMTFDEIGAEIGGRCHSATLYAVNQVRERLKRHAGLRHDVAIIEGML